MTDQFIRTEEYRTNGFGRIQRVELALRGDASAADRGARGLASV
jgi:hypothetical protein